MHGRLALGVLALMAIPLGCSREYQIDQFDNFAVQTFDPRSYQTAAIVTHRRTDEAGDRLPEQYDRNKLFLEAFQVELMKRGFEVVEREKFAKLLNEQLLVRGEMTDLSDREKAMRLGKMMNVDVVFYADALVNRSRFTYEKRLFLSSEAQAYRQQQETEKSGIVEGIGRFTIHAYHDVGVTVRAIDARTGGIVWVGYRMLASCEQVTEESATALTSFSTIKQLCGDVLDDLFTPVMRLGANRG